MLNRENKKWKKKNEELQEKYNKKWAEAFTNETLINELKEENRKFIEKTNSSNIEKLTKNDIIGIYTNNEQLYVVLVMDTLVGAGRSEAILDVNNKRINYIY